MAGHHYTKREEPWFEARGLRRHAGVFQLWALGVGAGGFGGLLIALVIMTCLYVGLSFSLAELSAALPHTGGAYSFARASMGPWGGYLTGLAENMEYIFTPATIVVGIGGYLGVVSLATLAALFLNSDYRTGVLGAAVWFLFGVAYFAFPARHRLILSPEEEFAVNLAQSH